MNTFGEIVEPSSRTQWEDWDENIAEQSHSKLMWQNSFEIPGAIQTLFIFEGRYIADSIKNLTKFKLELINSIPEVNLKLYRAEGSDVYICVLNEYNLLLSSEVVELLKQYIFVSNDVIGILTKPIVEYQTFEKMSQPCILRSFVTTKPLPKSLTFDIPKLEQPNIVSGVTAGVISLREILNLNGAAIICYMEHSDDYQINELQQLLKKLNFGPIQPQPGSLMNSNLYI